MSSRPPLRKRRGQRRRRDPATSLPGACAPTSYPTQTTTSKYTLGLMTQAGLISATVRVSPFDPFAITVGKHELVVTLIDTPGYGARRRSVSLFTKRISTLTRAAPSPNKTQDTRTNDYPGYGALKTIKPALKPSTRPATTRAPQQRLERPAPLIQKKRKKNSNHNSKQKSRPFAVTVGGRHPRHAGLWCAPHRVRDHTQRNADYILSTNTHRHSRPRRTRRGLSSTQHATQNTSQHTAQRRPQPNTQNETQQKPTKLKQPPPQKIKTTRQNKPQSKLEPKRAGENTVESLDVITSHEKTKVDTQLETRRATLRAGTSSQHNSKPSTQNATQVRT